MTLILVPGKQHPIGNTEDPLYLDVFNTRKEDLL